MKIVELTAENIKKVKAVHIKPDGNVVMICGRNEQGKSSVLDSIIYALGGKADIDERPIRDGEDSAKVELDLGEYTVKRTFTEKGSYLEIKDKKGFKAGSPQALLNQIVGQISFDPLAFIKQGTKAQRKMLLDLVGVDLTAHDSRAVELRAKRSAVNADIKRQGVAVEALPKLPDDLPEEETSVAELLTELQAANTHNKDIDSQETHIRSLVEQQARVEREIKSNEDQIRLAQEGIAKKEGAVADLKTEITLNRESLKDIGGPIDAEVISTKIADAQVTNKLIQQAIEQKKKQQGLEATKGEYGTLGNQLQAIEQEKHQLLVNAKMPIEGLAVTDGGVEYKGHPISQISSSEKLRVGMAIGMAQNPKLKVLRIMDGSLLDEDNLKVVGQMVADKDYQIWIEKVDSSGQCGIVIEDGSIVNGQDDQEGGKDTEAESMPRTQPVAEAATSPA